MWHEHWRKMSEQEKWTENRFRLKHFMLWTITSWRSSERKRLNVNTGFNNNNHNTLMALLLFGICLLNHHLLVKIRHWSWNRTLIWWNKHHIEFETMWGWVYDGMFISVLLFYDSWHFIIITIPSQCIWRSIIFTLFDCKQECKHVQSKHSTQLKTSGMTPPTSQRCFSLKECCLLLLTWKHH